MIPDLDKMTLRDLLHTATELLVLYKVAGESDLLIRRSNAQRRLLCETITVLQIIRQLFVDDESQTCPPILDLLRRIEMVLPTKHHGNQS